MSTKAVSMPANATAICSIISFTMCILLRSIIFVISISQIAKNFNEDELNLQNTEELEGELGGNNEEQYEESSHLKDELYSRSSNTEGGTLLIPRKRTREAILEINSSTELSYVIEKYRCVAILYQDGSEVRKM